MRRLVAAMLVLVAPLVLAEPPGVYAIRGGTVHPVSGPVLANGTVVIRDGLIESVGTAAPPADALVIDATGMHVYPGLIDAHTSAGFTTPKRGSGERPQEPRADTIALRTLALTDDELNARRSTGVTTIVAAPAYGIFNGQSALVNLGAGPNESRVVKSPVALQISFDTRPTWTFPDSLMGVIAHVRQSLFDAQQHAAAREIYERSPAGLQRPPNDPALEALQPFLRRELPVVFVATSDQMMRRAQAIARELELRYILAGAQGAHEIAGELKGVPLLVSVDWPKPPADKEERADQPLRIIRERQLAPTTPAVLASAGASFALVSAPAKAGDFLPGIRKAIDHGLSADDALRAVTLTPAGIFGVSPQLGSLERGKIANVIVTDKPLFEEKAKVTRVFIDGRELRLPKEEAKEGAAASPIDGTWSISVETSQGNVAISVTLEASDGKLSGTYSGDRGSGDIRGGTIDGQKFEFTISATASEAETSDWVFSGTIDGDSMSGSVTTTLGTFNFSGSKSE